MGIGHGYQVVVALEPRHVHACMGEEIVLRAKGLLVGQLKAVGLLIKQEPELVAQLPVVSPTRTDVVVVRRQIVEVVIAQ